MSTHLRKFLARPGLVLVTGALALTLAACGGGSTTAASSTTTPQSTRPSGPNTPPGTFGTAAAVTASSVEVQNQQSGQVTVNFTSSTTFTDTVAATLADVQAGECASVTANSGGAQATALTAVTVQLSTPPASGCTAGGGFGGGGPRGSRTPNPSRQPNPSGAPSFGRAFGSVTAVSATGFTVHGVARGSNPAVTTTVTVTSSTTYTKTGSATSSALAVGDCVAAIGPSDDTGAVAAKTISISKPGKNGCSLGFGGRGFRGGGNGGGQGGTGGGNG